jgi:hypothetical protein
MNDAAKTVASNDPATAHDTEDEATPTGAGTGTVAPDDSELLGDSKAALERSSE